MRTHTLLAISSATALAILSAILPAQAQDRANQPQTTAPLATTDPLKTIYRVSGIRDNGGLANAGVATSFHCTNFSSVPEKIRFFIRNFSAVQVADISRDVPAFRTHTASTHGTAAFNEDTFLAPGILIEQGSAVIQSTSLNVHCSAMIVDGAAAAVGIALHMVRLNPAPGTQE